MERVIINIPFNGFYDSLYSCALDRELEQYVEYKTDPDQSSEEEAEWADVKDAIERKAWEFVDYSKSYEYIAEEYMQAFNSVASVELGFELGLTWESMVSPREYNFGTDRLFAYIPITSVKALLAIVSADGFASLGEAVMDRFTSYDGFLSFYSNDVEAWKDKDVSEWDHNELCTLLEAALRLKGFDLDDRERAFELYEATFSGNGEESAALNAGMDWDKLEAFIAETREEMKVSA